MAVNPRGDRMRCHSVPSVTDMSISAWPSIEPTRPRSACRRASSTMSRRRNARNRATRITTISGPPRNSAAANGQPRRRTMMMLSSTTRFVEANSKAIAAVKFAPLRKIDRASATAAYEHDDDAAPSAHAIASVRGESSGSSRLIWRLETTAWTTPESAKPRISAQRISQSIAKAKPSACPMPASTVVITIPPVSSHLALEPIFARGVGVVRHRALAQLREAQPPVEPVRVLEAGVRPQHQPCEGVGAAPRDYLLHQRPAEAAAAQVRVEIEAVDLGGGCVHPLHADRADQLPGVAHDPEGAVGRRVVLVEAEEIREFGLRFPDEAVLLPDASQERDDVGHVGACGGDRLRHA